MKKLMTILMAFALFLLPLSLAAQAEEEEKASPNYINATYFYCPVSTQEKADEVVKAKFVPIYDAAVEAGTISAWGWLAHRAGGKWRRVLYFSAPGLDAMLDAADDLFAKTGEAMGDDTTFGDSCPAHDDYFWTSDNVGSSAEKRGPAGFSVYFFCDQAKESRADEIMKEHFAPVYDKLVEEGKITSWGWLQHFVGGKIRRLSTMTGADHKSLLSARNEAIAALYGEDNEAGAEFGSICTDHIDYMWDFQHESP